jgi:hypothetical protein
MGEDRAMPAPVDALAWVLVRDRRLLVVRRHNKYGLI